MNLHPINIIAVTVILVCLGVISFVGYNTYLYNEKVQNFPENIYLISKDDKQSISTSYAVTVKDVNVNLDTATDILSVENKDGTVIYSSKRENFYGGIEVNKFCTSLRMEGFSDKPGKVSLTGLNCTEKK